MLFCYLSGKCQDYTYRNYNIKDGLVGNHVYHAVEDKDNFLWFATETGVSRFDGNSFKNFTTKEGLPNNDILKLFVDSKGRVWMMPFTNAICYYYKGKVYNSSNDATLKSFNLNGLVHNMAEDNEGNLYFVYDAGFLFVLKKNGKLLHYNNSNLFPICIGNGANKKIQVFANAINGNRVNVGTKLYEIILSEDSIRINQIKKETDFTSARINESKIDSSLLIYIYRHGYSSNEFICFQINDSIKQIKNVYGRQNSISNFRDSFCDINTIHGSVKLNYKNNSFAGKTLENESITYSFIDFENNTWFLTGYNGIYRRYSEGVVNAIAFEGNAKKSDIYSLISRDSILYFGNHLAELNSFNYKIGIFKIKKIILSNDDEILLQFKKRFNDLYCVQEHNFYKVYSEESKKANRLFGISTVSFKDFDFDKKGNVFYATNAGVFSYWLKDYTRVNFFYPHRSTSIALIDSGIYIGTLSGLKFANWNKEVVDFGKRIPLLGGAVTKLFYNKNLIWVGTSNSGLLCFDGNKIIKVIDTKSGLNDNAITCIYASGNFLWAGTNSGLAKIDLTTKNVLKTYSESDGILGNKINDVYSDGNKIFVATETGLFILDEKKIDDFSICSMVKPEVFISDLPLSQDQENIYLKPNESIEFKYTAVSFKSEGKIDYYYRLLGLDTTWQSTSSNYIKYQVLPHREFEFQIYAVNRFGVKSKMIPIPFEVSKKLYEKTWFILSSIFLLFVLIWGFIRNRIASNKRKLELKFENDERNSNLEQAALKAQMNPHFIFNCLNSIQYFVIEKDVFNANKFIAIFSSLIRQTLENSGKKYITIAEEVHYLKTYIEVEQNRFEDKFVCEFNIATDIDENNQCIPPMLLQPFVENSINHGLMHRTESGGLITIEFTVNKLNLICIITDNGVGRTIADQYNLQGFNRHQSIGIALTQKRINMINNSTDQSVNYKIEDVFNINNEIAGTRVTILLPKIFRDIVD